jgi:hypothetical protein
VKPRNTLLLALVVAALGAFVWFYEIEGGAEREKREAASKQLFPDVTAEQIQSIELRTDEGTNVRSSGRPKRTGRSSRRWRRRPTASPSTASRRRSPS